MVWSLFGHAAFQYLHAGSELGLFQLLYESTGAVREKIGVRLGLEPQPLRCLLLALTATGLIEKDGSDYRNCDAVEQMFQDGTWPWFVDIVRFEAHLAYIGEIDLVESLRSGRNVGLERISGTGPDLYHRLDEHPELQAIFYRYMSSWTSLGVNRMLARVDLSGVESVVDVGGGDGTAAIAIAQAYPQMQIEVIELPAPAKVARAKIATTQVAQRVHVTSADFFEHEFPASVDCFFFIHLLVIWPLETVVELLRRAYCSLQPGGKVVILNSMISDADDGPLFAALDTAYFVSLPARGGMIYSWSDFERCLEQAGFAKHYRVELGLWTPQGAIVAEKD